MVKRNIVVLHVVFWLMLLVFKFFDYQHSIGITKSLVLVLVPNAFNIIASYTHYFFLLPFLLKKNYRSYFPWVIILLLSVTYARGEAESFFFEGLFASSYYQKWTGIRFVGILWATCSLMLFISLINFTVDRFRLQTEKQALETEKLHAELNYLKAQINPHFLFNTLHNLNYQTQVKSDLATDIVIRLSNIMRYMIYESNKPKVTLGQEIDYLQDYLSLESIRLNHQFKLDFETAEVPLSAQVAPLLLIPLVENAFKHGISDLQPINWISIKLRIHEGKLEFRVANSLRITSVEKEGETGFGLTNLRSRLELNYFDRYQLDLLPMDNSFQATLTLQLNENEMHHS